jgi:ribosome-associated translation inhibitor RaiA
MSLEIKLDVHDFVLSDDEDRRIHQQLAGLERRLVHRPDPTAVLVLKQLVAPRQVQVDLRLRLGPLGPQLISHQAGTTADQAVRLAVADVERQLERHTARQRGEHTYGVPSRRLPTQLRPNPPQAPDLEAVSE